MCQEEADTLAHALLRCSAIWMLRRRILGAHRTDKASDTQRWWPNSSQATKLYRAR